MPSFATRARRRPRRATAACAAVAALTVLALPAGSAAQRAHTASVATCPASGLVAWLDTAGNGAAGTIFYTLHLTNLSGHRCTVRGYPGVSPAALSGHQIGPAALRSGMPAHTVTLSNGAGAKANLGIAEAGNFPPSHCHQTTAAGLRVFAPGSAIARFVPFPFAACTHIANLRISPLR